MPPFMSCSTKGVGFGLTFAVPISHTMSNRWGNFCTPEEYALSQQKYPPIHCYTVGEIIGLLCVVISSLISLASILYVFAVIVKNVLRERRQRLPRPLITQSMDVFLLSLFASEFVLSIAGSLSAKYIHDGKVQVGTTCMTQVVFGTVGPGSLAMITLVIAVYTFSVVWWGMEQRSLLFAWSVVGVIWTYHILFVTLMAWHYRWDTLFHPTPYWCWIGKYYVVQKLFTEYLWMWCALFLSFLLYIPLFLWSQGYLSPDNKVWWKFRVHARSQWALTDANVKRRRRSMTMIAYPLLYAFVVMPSSTIRWTGYVQENTGRHINTIPPAATFTGRSIFALSGLFSVILFLKTRPNVLLMTPRPEYDNPASPIYGHRRRGENDRFAHPLSLETGRHWLGEDLKPSVEGCERASDDGGSVARPNVVGTSSSLGTDVRFPNAQHPPKN